MSTNGISRRLSDGVISNYPIIDNLGRTQQALFVNEDGLYDVILDSRKPEAKAFRKWITSEVLPTIRQTGGYMVTKVDETPEETMARALLLAQRTIEAQKNRADYEAERAAQLDATVELQQKELKTAAPKVEYYDNVLQSNSGIAVNVIAD